jgi:hypothetical protein
MNALYDIIEEHEYGNESVRSSLQRAKTVTTGGRGRSKHSRGIVDGGYGFYYD